MSCQPETLTFAQVVGNLDICLSVLELDSGIRFAAIVSSKGKILAAEFREGTKPLLSLQESELSVMQSLIRMSIRRTLESRLGMKIHVVAVYQKVNRAKISLFNKSGKCDCYLMVSFEKQAHHVTIINKKILPFLEEIDRGLKLSRTY
jgi:hypothetical protein